jgi:hypothetical protein
MEADFNFRIMMYFKKMREEALELYDYCLAEGSVEPLMSFLEELIAINTAPLNFLYEIADDIQQRFVALRENHYDVRHQVVRAIQTLYQADVSLLFPPDDLDNYHLTEADTVLAGLMAQGIAVDEEERDLLQRLIRQSCQTALQLQEDIELTEDLQAIVSDWLLALSGTVARQYSAFYPFIQNQQPPLMH